jgi:hypothetical protein
MLCRDWIASVKFYYLNGYISSHDFKGLGQFEARNQFVRWVRGKRRREVFRSCGFVRRLRSSDGKHALPRLHSM